MPNQVTRIPVTLYDDDLTDDLYNILLQQFVSTAVERGIMVTKHSRFLNWTLTCEVVNTIH